VPRRRFWTGRQQIKPFQVVVQPEKGRASTVEGTFEQDPIVPRWAVATAIAVVALTGVLAGLWFTLVKPAVSSAATEAVAAAASKEAAVRPPTSAPRVRTPPAAAPARTPHPHRPPPRPRWCR